MKIEKDIPIPSRNKGSKFFGQMDVGDSFIAEKSMNYYHILARRANAKVTSRKQEDGTTRVWLVAKEGPQ